MTAARGPLTPSIRSGPEAAAGQHPDAFGVPLIVLSVALQLLSPLGPDAAAPSPLRAQEVPREEYLRFLPLEPPRIVGQTRASERFHLYGDPTRAGYRDVDPVDGVDDRRHQRLMELAVRFAPHMLRNTTSLPMAFEAFVRAESHFPLHVDTWSTVVPGGELLETRTIEFGDSAGPEDDRALAELVRELEPAGGGSGVPPVEEPEGETLPVLFFDFPGEKPGDWRSEYQNLISGRLPRSYRDYRQIYVHPFIQQADTPPSGESRYELVLQYWFFYPFNDGGNDHEGDWEHLNVVLTTRGAAGTALEPATIRRILGPGGEANRRPDGRTIRQPLPVEELLMGRLEYFFHKNVMVVDFLDPDVYQPRDAWQRVVDSRAEELLGEKWFWKRIREMAYTGPEEREVNTHPLVYIGADNKGLDQLLALPGGANRDSHGSYPFPGLYKDIGPARAAEEVNGPLRPHWTLEPGGRSPPDELERFDDPARIRIVPDWERVVDLSRDSAEVRRDWSWLFLPVRWGYPASRSLLAGVVKHAPTGNLAPLGPAFNRGWNRTGVTGRHSAYEPHKLGGVFPLSWQDSFVNSWGFLNVTLPTLSILPPFDFSWRVLLLPARAPVQSRSPTFFPRDRIPFRLVGVGGGLSVSILPDNFTLLFTEPGLFDQIQGFIDSRPGETVVVNEGASAAVAPVGRMQFHLGKHLVSENVIRRINGRVRFDIEERGTGQTTPVRADLELWEYAGSLRYNVLTGGFQPYVRGGYGISWFRLRNARLGDEPLDPASTPWLRKPSVTPPENLLPNTFHLGLGVEAVPIRNFGPFPRGTDVGVRAGYALYFHGLGLERREPFAEQEDFTLVRGQLDLGISLSF